MTKADALLKDMDAMKEENDMADMKSKAMQMVKEYEKENGKLSDEEREKMMKKFMAELEKKMGDGGEMGDEE